MSAYESEERVEERARPSYGTKPKAHVEDGRRREFFIVDNVVVDELLANHGPYAFAVYCYLVRLASKEGHAYPSAKRISEACKMSDRQAREMLKVLQDEGMISAEPRFSEHGDQESNLYTILDSRSRGGAPGAGGVGHQVPPNKEYTHGTNIPPTPQGADEGEVVAVEAAPQKLGPNKYFTALEEDYFIRLIRGDEWLQIEDQLDRWSKKGYRISFSWFQEACVEARAACKADSGRFPRTVTPLINHLADLIADMTPRNGG